MGMRTASRHIAALIRDSIDRGGERLWHFDDFRGLPLTAVAQALSRLSRAGAIERLSKGLYYRARMSAFGPTRPNPAALRQLAARRKPIFPAGISAANLLGFTTQNPKQGELATSALSLPRKLIGDQTVVHTRRPEAWTALSETDAALLDFLRRRGLTSELSPKETVAKLLSLMADRGRFDRLLKAARTEPPRVRAMLGAIGQQIGKSPRSLRPLRESLNPLSRFDFGMLASLKHAREWQAKERRTHATV